VHLLAGELGVEQLVLEPRLARLGELGISGPN
jgi:hypothetical protein